MCSAIKLKKYKRKKPKQTKKPPRTPWITQSQEKEGNTGRAGQLICSGRLYTSKGRVTVIRCSFCRSLYLPVLSRDLSDFERCYILLWVFFFF